MSVIVPLPPQTNFPTVAPKRIPAIPLTSVNPLIEPLTATSPNMPGGPLKVSAILGRTKIMIPPPPDIPRPTAQPTTIPTVITQTMLGKSIIDPSTGNFVTVDNRSNVVMPIIQQSRVILPSRSGIPLPPVIPQLISTQNTSMTIIRPLSPPKGPIRIPATKLSLVQPGAKSSLSTFQLPSSLSVGGEGRLFPVIPVPYQEVSVPVPSNVSTIPGQVVFTEINPGTGQIRRFQVFLPKNVPGQTIEVVPSVPARSPPGSPLASPIISPRNPINEVPAKVVEVIPPRYPEAASSIPGITPPLISSPELIKSMIPTTYSTMGSVYLR
ncbi:Hypothetical protein HVR_LOCUS738 [uncultured virus]|nr:Hypothetical protein HVR_LOCUS738 [uncultured virus]